MGASYVSGFYEGSDKEAVKKAFLDDQDQDRYENGSSYSGGIGMASGASFIAGRVFTSIEEADDWVVDTAVKWGPAIFVRVKGDDVDGWFYGVWCSS